MPEATEIWPGWTWQVLAVAWGAIWGSFGNVVIARLPERRSIVRPASHCPECETPIRWFDNVPVLSWIVLRGRCRKCGWRIPVRYPLVEAACAALAWLAMRRLLLLGEEEMPLFATTFMIHFAFLWALLVLTVIDLRTMLLPDAITLPGIVVGLTFVLIVDRENVLWHALSSAGVYLFIYVFFVLLYRLIAKREGMGMGDAKLLAMVGALLGPQAVIFTLVAGALQGLVVNIPFLLLSRRGRGDEQAGGRQEGTLDGDGDGDEHGEEDEETPEEEPEPPQTGPGEETRVVDAVLRTQVPFGPMLSLAAFEYFFWGEALINWYYETVDVMLASGAG